mmetsp:Transcript_4541/g.11419  ORF Transcript_4541/g.11419 Transcript_4541/m.11419 type:complete len:380 (-) Transcript_4541:138-1277(-)
MLERPPPPPPPSTTRYTSLEPLPSCLSGTGHLQSPAPLCRHHSAARRRGARRQQRRRTLSPRRHRAIGHRRSAQRRRRHPGRRHGGHERVLARHDRRLVLQQHRRDPPEQVPAVHLGLQVPHLPHHVSHGDVRLPQPRVPHLRVRAQAGHQEPAALHQGGGAGRGVRHLRGGRQRVPALHPRVLQPGHRRHHALLHRAAVAVHHAPEGNHGGVRHPRAHCAGHRPGQQQRAAVPPVGVPGVLQRHVRARPEVCAAGAVADQREREAGLAQPAAVHVARGARRAGGCHNGDGTLGVWRVCGELQRQPQVRVDPAAQLRHGVRGEPHQLPGDEVHVPADPAGAGQRQGGGGGVLEHHAVQEPGQQRGHGGVHHHGARRRLL